MTGAATRSGEPYTETEILRAIRLYKMLGGWGPVGERLGRSPGSLQVQVTRYRRGELRFGRVRAKVESEELAELAFSGLSMAEIARRRGCRQSNICQRLHRIGVDQEVINMVRAERKRGHDEVSGPAG